MVLDTSVCVDLLREAARKETGPAHRALKGVEEVRVYLTLFSVCELYTGIYLSRQPEGEQARVQSFIQHLTVLDPNVSFPILYGEAAAGLLSRGTPIPVMDLLIGITAKAHGLPVLTRDPTHFRRIPGLTVQSYPTD